MQEAALKTKFQEALQKDLRTERERRAKHEAALVQMLLHQHRRIRELESAIEPFSRMQPWETPMAEWVLHARRTASLGEEYRKALVEMNQTVRIIGLEFSS